MYTYIYIYVCVYIYIYIYTHVYISRYTLVRGGEIHPRTRVGCPLAALNRARARLRTGPTLRPARLASSPYEEIPCNRKKSLTMERHALLWNDIPYYRTKSYTIYKIPYYRRKSLPSLLQFERRSKGRRSRDSLRPPPLDAKCPFNIAGARGLLSRSRIVKDSSLGVE